MNTKDIEHPDQPDPMKRRDPLATPEPVARQDGYEVVEAKQENRKLRDLAKLAGGPVEQLKEE